MTTVLEPPPPAAPQAARQLRTTMAAMRLSFTWLGTRKTLTAQQKAQAAESFGATGSYLSAGKKLLDTRHPAYKAVTAVRSRSVQYWRSLSLPYPEPGVRLIRQDQLEAICSQMQQFRTELAEAVAGLDRHYEELKGQAQQRLGDLYDPTDYPVSLQGLFALDWDFPSVDPPDYLRQLNPEVYERECRRVQARFSEAVELAEQAFLAEFAELVGHLTERLQGDSDGKPKIFRDSAVTNLTEFFERFRNLNVGSNDELDRLITEAQQIVRGVEPQQLRNNNNLRQQVSAQLSDVQSVLDELLIERPRRNILRPAQTAEDR